MNEFYKIGREYRDRTDRFNLNNSLGLHSDNGTWAEFLSNCYLAAFYGEWKLYQGTANHFYIVSPKGNVYRDYGISAQQKFNDIIHRNKSEWVMFLLGLGELE